MKGQRSSNGFASFIRGFDLYRKVPVDLTEASFVGGTVSVIAGLILLLLFGMEIRQFLMVNDVTSIVIDHSEDGVFQVNFNLTIEGLSCEFAAVDIRNVIGKKREDIQDKTVHKYSLDGMWQGFAEKDNKVHRYEGTNKDHYGNTRHAIELTASTFHRGIEDYEAMLVDFHAPWCIHCRHLAPVYEHAAEMVKEKAPQEIDNHHRHAVALATVDCTTKENIPLCKQYHIQAFPTILVFRQGKNKAEAVNPFLKAHESYHGERTADAISTFALAVLKDVIKGDADGIKFGGGTDSTGDGKVDSKVRTRGCRIEGYLMVQRVPGSISIRPHSTGHDFNTGLINMDHHINHLSFGNRRPTQVRHQRVDRMDGAYAEHVGRPIVLQEGLDEVGFVSGKTSTSHEHYVKVVSRTKKPLNDAPEHTYEYTINSNMYDAEEGIPAITFTYDLSPLKVVVEEQGRPWIEGLTGMCAILGGVYTCFVIFEAVLNSAVCSITKKIE